jgi:CubicO group peptidase (beta-lactamase class C family)
VRSAAGTAVDGTVASGWEPVRDALEANGAPEGADPGDLGAAVCVTVQGRPVVDIWHGWADRMGLLPWSADTLVNAYSVVKPVAAVLALLDVRDGLLQLDEPLHRVWPGLAGEGRELITLRHVLAHRAGLPAVRESLPDDALYSWQTMVSALAGTRPWWPPGSAHGYHVNTFGFLAGEPVRRLHSTSFGRALRTRLTGPLGLDLHVGLDDDALRRVAEVDVPGPVDPGFLPGVSGDPDPPMLRNAYTNPAGLSGIGVVNTDRWRRAAVPSTNGHATARALAGFYADLLGPDAVVPAELLGEATRTQAAGQDRVLGRPSRFGLGFMLHQDNRPIGLGPASFGHYGYGGSLGFADPEAGLAFAYLINRPGDRWQNPRTRRLIEAVRHCVSG